MVTWIHGASGMGKTTLARKMADDSTVLLDGDDMRKVWPELGFSKEDRTLNNLRIARLARVFDLQGFNVVVATICPYEDLRAQVQVITNCRFIHLEPTEDVKTWPSGDGS